MASKLEETSFGLSPFARAKTREGLKKEKKISGAIFWRGCPWAIYPASGEEKKRGEEGEGGEEEAFFNLFSTLMSLKCHSFSQNFNSAFECSQYSC